MKKILAMLLAVALVASLAVPALATDEGATNVVVEPCNGDHTGWTEFTTEIASQENIGAGNYYLSDDFTAPKQLQFNANVTLCLNGCDLVRAGRLLRVYAGTLNICNCKNTGGTFQGAATAAGGTVLIQQTGTVNVFDGVTLTHAPDITAGDGGVVWINNGGFLNLYGGTIAGGKSSASGGNICVDKGEVNMYSGTITGGQAQRGGNVFLKGADAKFYMHSGTISDGALLNPSASVAHGGNIHVREGASFTMYGGTISGGNAGEKRGGNIAVVSSGNLSVSGESEILGGTASEGPSIWTNVGPVITVTGGRIEKGIQSSGAVKVTGGQFDTTDVSAWIDYTKDEETGVKSLTLTDDLTLPGALEIAEDVTINLAGNKITNGVNVAADKVLTLADTSTDDYTTAGVLVKVTGEGTVKSDAVVNSKRYVAIKETVNEDTYYSAHRIYLAVTSSVLSNGCSAMNFKTMLKCNDYVAKRITEYGVIVNGNAVAYEGAVAAGANEKTTQLTGFLNKDAEDATRAATDVQVNATIKLGETVINSKVKTRSLKTMVETVAQGWDALDADQQTTLKTLYATYGATAGMEIWNIPDEMKAN